jgi:integrase
MAMKLDSKAVASLDLGGNADLIVFDSALTGFGYRLRAGSGGKALGSWIVQYRRNGRSRRLRLGSAEVLTAEQARAAAKTALAKVALGQDPQGDKAAQREADKTFAAVVEDFLQAKNGTIRPSSYGETARYLTGSYFKPLHAMPFDQIARRDVAARLLAISRENGRTAAARARSAISELYSWGMGQGLAGSNPVSGTLKPKAGKPRDRVLSDQELAAMWREVGGNEFGRIVRLLILTGARRTEVGGMTWQEVNFDKATWTLPAARAKNDHEHVLPLGETALDIIKSTPRKVGHQNLFGPRAAGFTAWHHGKKAIDARLGDRVGPWILHDLRRTAATRMCDLGVAPHIVEQILNHRSGHRAGIVGVYNHSRYEREVKAAVELWDKHIRTIASGDYSIRND